MRVLNKLFGYRWSLYIVRNETTIVYAMHEHSVMRISGYVMDYFAEGKTPCAPWSLYLNFNRTHQTIKLGPEHFSLDGKDVSKLLTQQIEAIDPGWIVRGAEPVFEEAATKKRLKITNYELRDIDIQKMLDDVGKPRELTFFDVMDDVFGMR